MRLLNTKTSKLETFFGKKAPPYVILSHTWESDEVELSEWGKPEIIGTAGYRKIEGARRQACEDGIDYLWVDTCCIDKKSSAELSEAINSMFKWYGASQYCYALLQDFSLDSFLQLPNLGGSRWFTRGFTLQELLAPRNVKFYDASWRFIGDKHSLGSELERHTHVDAAILRGERQITTASVAQRMSWASTRETSREEDIAYCLLGIFNVNMPLLYGEGMKAFIRLQEMIMKEIDDPTLFAWTDPNSGPFDLYGLLATHPRMFRYTGDYMNLRELRLPPPNGLTSRGVSLQMSLERINDENYLYQAVLDCALPTSSVDTYAVIFLRKLDEFNSEYVRVLASEIDASEQSTKSKMTSIYVRQSEDWKVQDQFTRARKQMALRFKVLTSYQPMALLELDVARQRQVYMECKSATRRVNLLGCYLLDHRAQIGDILLPHAIGEEVATLLIYRDKEFKFRITFFKSTGGCRVEATLLRFSSNGTMQSRSMPRGVEAGDCVSFRFWGEVLHVRTAKPREIGDRLIRNVDIKIVRDQPDALPTCALDMQDLALNGQIAREIAEHETSCERENSIKSWMWPFERLALTSTFDASP